MTRLAHAWRTLGAEQRLAALAALALLVTMFFPWYGLQSLNRKTGAIYSHSINAFGDVSFVEAAIFLVAAGVIGTLFARAEGRSFHLPGGDGTVVMVAGLWATLLIFFRVFSRPAGDGYPVGIEWGFFLAFVASGGLAYAGLRMRTGARPEPPRQRPRGRRERPGAEPEQEPFTEPVVRRGRATPAPARERAAHPRPPASAPSPSGSRASSPYPPSPPEQLSFEDPPPRAD
jgi:hypothetical protein